MDVGELDSKIAELEARVSKAQGLLDTATQTTQSWTALSAQLSTALEEARDHEGQIAATLQQIVSNATSVDDLTNKVRTSLSTVDANLLQSQAATKKADDEAAEAARHKESAVSAANELLAKSSEVDSLRNECAALRLQIEALLPGATSAGLAREFSKRARVFQNFIAFWQGVFLTSVIALAAFALWAYAHSPPNADWDLLGRTWIAKAPLIGAMIWLAIHASREAALASRLEEDYAYKAAVSASLQGFHKQVEALVRETENKNQLAELYRGTLEIVGTPPGRLYEKQPLISTPVAEAAAAAKSLLPAGMQEGKKE